MIVLVREYDSGNNMNQGSVRELQVSSLVATLFNTCFILLLIIKRDEHFYR